MSGAFGGSILAVAGLLVLGPIAVGHLAQAAYRDLVSGLAQRLPDAEVRQSRYRRGWLRSDTGLELLLSDPAAVAPLRIRLESQIDQGPWVWVSSGLPPALARVRTRVEIGGPNLELPPLLVTTALSVDGSGAARIRAPAGEIAVAADAARIRHAELSALVRVGPDRRTVWTSLSLPAIALLDEAGPRASLSALRLDAELTGDGAGSRRGSGALDPASAHRGALLDLRLSLSAGGIVSGEEAYGPAEIRLAAERLDAAALDALTEGLRTLGSDPVSQPMRGLLMAGLIARVVPRLAAGGARLAIDPVRVRTPQGPATGRLELCLETPGDAPSRSPLDRGAGLTMLRAEGEFDLPEAAALSWLERIGVADAWPESAGPAGPQRAREDARALLEAWVRDGWVSRDGGRLSSALRLGDALMTINGKTFPLLGPG